MWTVCLRSRCARIVQVLAVMTAGWASGQAFGQANGGPDVIAGDVLDASVYGTFGTTAAISMRTDSCNIGDQPLDWLALPDNRHPVIAQNMYRLKDGRLRQIGQAWVKHGFAALQENLCFTDCQENPDGTALGVHCSDPYSAGLNRGPMLGPRSEINPVTGFFDPATANDHTGHNHTAVSHGLQVSQWDLGNPGARYFIEAQYIAPDDATAGNGNNNVSYREVAVTGSFFSRTITDLGPVVQEEPAIMAWPGAMFSIHDSWPDDGRIIVASKATQVSGSLYRYDYAVYNMNSDRGIRWFSVPMQATLWSALVFAGVPSHEEGLSNAPWVGTLVGSNVRWQTDLYTVNPNANAIRWGTMYNFWFYAFGAPVPGVATLGKFKPGTDASVFIADVMRPSSGDCNHNGIADAQEIAGCAPGDATCADCNGNLLLDGCEIAWNDCNGNGTPDDCDIASGAASDCNGNEQPDVCELAGNDCDGNGVIDECDVAGGGLDCNLNGVLDVCEGNPICFNDACIDAVAMCPGSLDGTTILATDDGSSSCFGGSDVWFAYTPGFDGDATIATCGSALDTVVSVHAACPGTTANQVACNDDATCGFGSVVTFPVTAGTTYMVRVAGFFGDTGSYTLDLTGPACGAPCTLDTDCDDGAPCTTDTCTPAGACMSTTTTLACEGFVLSRNADFSTDDRTFTKNETMYMRVWSNQVDFNDIDKAEWQLIDAGGKKINKPLTNHFDGTYTASWDLAQLPSNALDWTWSALVLDKTPVSYAPSDAVVVLPECTGDADCDDALFCNGAETCDAAQVCEPGTSPCNGNQVCDEAGDVCFTPICGDGACNGAEDGCTCPQDCGGPPAAETSCANGVDDDCDGLLDCDDLDCIGDPACPNCLPNGAPCTADEQCCLGRCRLQNGSVICD
ncbi:MAG: hypothetical protein ACE5E6_02945 [Phycisphaerae bacterium]